MIRMMQVWINGELREVPENLQVAMMLEYLGLAGQPLLVEQNGVALFQRDWADHAVQAEDRFELIRIVAGG